MARGKMRQMMLWLGLLGTLTLAWLFLPRPAVFQTTPVSSKVELGFENPAQYQRYETLAKTLRCIVCQNQNLWESNTQAALSLKAILKAQIQQGVSDAELTSWMISQYGDFISYDPPKTGLTRLLWFGPVILLSFALLVVRRKIRWSGFSGV